MFDRVEGSHFTILGMPLLPLLGALRERGLDAVMTSRPYAEVIGDPIEHSLSPVIHGFWLEALGIEADYRPPQVTRAELAGLSRRAARRSATGAGANVTMPLKLDAVALADEATDRAVAAGAANVLMLREGKLVAGQHRCRRHRRLARPAARGQGARWAASPCSAMAARRGRRWSR